MRLVTRHLQSFGFSMQLHSMCASDMFSCTLGPQEFALEVLAKLKVIWTMIRILERLEADPSNPVFEIAAKILKHIGYHNRQTVREMFLLAQRCDFEVLGPSESAATFRKMALDIFEVPSNTKDFLEDVFGSVSLGRFTKLLQTYDESGVELVCIRGFVRLPPPPLPKLFGVVMYFFHSL